VSKSAHESQDINALEPVWLVQGLLA